MEQESKKSDYPRFIMLVGLPGSGKITHADELNVCGDYRIFSSDKMREKMFGDESIQGTPEEQDKLFTNIFRGIKKSLLDGYNVIYDATNLNKRRRIQFLGQLKGVNCFKSCEVIATLYESCLERNKNRKRVVPEEVIKRMYMNFQPPHYSEGWDFINIVYTNDKEDIWNHKIRLLAECINFNQENSNHRFTLDQHMILTKRYLQYTKNPNLLFAGLYHDIGKPFTKTKKNKKGEIDGEAHYYNHNCVGAYEILFFGKFSFIKSEDFMDISNLIYYHMHPFMVWDKSEEAMKRDKELLGDEFFNMVMELHEADVEAQKNRL